MNALGLKLQDPFGPGVERSLSFLPCLLACLLSVFLGRVLSFAEMNFVATVWDHNEVFHVVLYPAYANPFVRNL